MRTPRIHNQNILDLNSSFLSELCDLELELYNFWFSVSQCPDMTTNNLCLKNRHYFSALALNLQVGFASVLASTESYALDPHLSCIILL